MHRGYTKTYRKELESKIWFMPPIYHRVWFVIRQKAKFKQETFPTPKKFGIFLNPGQLITSMDQICKWASWTEWGKEKVPNKKTIKVVLEWLEDNGMLSVVSNGKGTFINITNWHIYNSIEEEEVTISGTRSGTHMDCGPEHGPETIKELNKEVQELQKNNRPKNGKHFSPPSFQEVKEYCQERKNNVDPKKWLNFYEAKGWMIGKNKMRDWRAAVRTWENKDNDKGGNQWI